MPKTWTPNDKLDVNKFHSVFFSISFKFLWFMCYKYCLTLGVGGFSFSIENYK